MRYRMRHLVALAMLIALSPLILGLAPAIQDLMNRIERLEAESKNELVVVDATGAEVGNMFQLLLGVPVVLFHFEGLTPFVLQVNTFGFRGMNTCCLYFASNDCSGTPLFEVGGPALISSGAFYHVPTGKTYVPPEAGTLSTAFSRMDADGNCFGINVVPQVYGPAIEVQELEQFSPPFRLISRGNLP